MNTDDSVWRLEASDFQLVRRTTFVREIEHHVTIASTNSRALVLAATPQLTVPTLVVADQQTAGRGRGANRWWAAPGALTFSLILNCPELADAASWPRLSLTTGIAVCEALHQLCPGLDTAVKWPNDVYVQTRKICGILVETSPLPCRRMVLGVGVNINNSFEQAPESIRSVGISLTEVARYSFSLCSALIAILQQLSTHLALLQHSPEELLLRWKNYCMLTGRRVQVDVGARRVAGVCQGINSHGALLVETQTGVETCLSGIVTRIDVGGDD